MNLPASEPCVEKKTIRRGYVYGRKTIKRTLDRGRVGRDGSLSKDRLTNIWLSSQKPSELIAAFFNVEMIANSLFQTWDRAEDELKEIYKLGNIPH